MGNLISLGFWFKLRPGLMSPFFDKAFLGLVAALLVATIVFFFLKKKGQGNLLTKVWESLLSFSITNFAIGLLLYFFNYEMVPFLSARFWFLFWLLEMIAWGVFIWKSYGAGLIKKEEMEKEKELKKYIP